MTHHKTAVIDIGSNSARLVIFEQSSRFGYRLICEQKSKVRIGEGAYNKGGNLQPIGTNRAFNALQAFQKIIKQYNTDKIICVATSALRDAPNRDDFISIVKTKLGLEIVVISGLEEARYGGIAASNLLSYNDCISIDIGGGSSDLALIRGGIVIETFSLDIGTVRIKELFFDKNIDTKHATKYIKEIIDTLPQSFKSDIAIGIGGTARTLASAIMKKNDYVPNKIHGFNFKLQNNLKYLRSIITSSIENLNSHEIKADRFDTIREGTLIFLEIVNKIKAKEITASGVGVREGVYLSHLLRETNLKFPQNVNPSVKNILDRFDMNGQDAYLERSKIATRLFNILYKEFNIDDGYLFELDIALKLARIGKNLTIYKSAKHSAYIALHELNYGFTHSQMALVSILLEANSRAKINKDSYIKYKELLPNKEVLKSYSFIYSLTTSIASYAKNDEIEFDFCDSILSIASKESLYLLKEAISEIKTLKGLTIKI
jgi:exopolyphosphatase/guanosine-5'-triphosphate,3'-diphosphate pyrophosphatase